MSENNKVAQAMDELNSNVKVVEDFQSKKKFNWVDRLVGFLFIPFAIAAFFISAWIDLSSLQLESGGTYGDLIAEQKAYLVSELGERKDINNISLGFSAFDFVLLYGENPVSPYTLIYSYLPEIQEALEDGDYPVNNRDLRGEGGIGQIIAGISIFGHAVVGFFGAGILLAGVWSLSPVGIVVQALGRKGTYGLIMATLLVMMASAWLWLFVFVSPTVNEILNNQDISVQPYNAIQLVSHGFWMNQALIVLLFAMTLPRFLSKFPEQSAEKEKN